MTDVADQLTKKARSALMARVKTRDTEPEVALRKAMYAAGIRGWRLHPRMPGRPDIVFRRRRVCVFVDGAFWHGHPDYYRGQSGPFWDAKIARNRRRDLEVTEALKSEGWTVLRFWDFEIAADAAGCADVVRSALTGSADDVRNGR